MGNIVTEAGTWLQAEFQGAAHLQQTLAYLNAVIRLRRVIVDGRTFFSVDDMVAHFYRLLNDPWITGSPHNMTAGERRSHRAHPPAIPIEAVIYASDGAARNQGTATAGQSSCGCVRYQ